MNVNYETIFRKKIFETLEICIYSNLFKLSFIHQPIFQQKNLSTKPSVYSIYFQIDKNRITNDIYFMTERRKKCLLDIKNYMIPFLMVQKDLI